MLSVFRVFCHMLSKQKNFQIRIIGKFLIISTLIISGKILNLQSDMNFDFSLILFLQIFKSGYVFRQFLILHPSAKRITGEWSVIRKADISCSKTNRFFDIFFIGYHLCMSAAERMHMEKISFS